MILLLNIKLCSSELAAYLEEDSSGIDLLSEITRPVCFQGVGEAWGKCSGVLSQQITPGI